MIVTLVLTGIRRFKAHRAAGSRTSAADGFASDSFSSYNMDELSSPSSTAPSPVPGHRAPSNSTAHEYSVNWKWMLILLVALLIPVFMETLDYTVVATAAIVISSSFHKLDLQSYIGSVYLLTSTVFLLPFASVSDIYGRHKALQAALVFFIIGSALSTGAQNMSMMLAGRAVAGIGGAGLLASVRIIMSDSRSLAVNTWQTSLLFVLYAIGYSVGPVIGGYLASVSWRWIFAINLPASVLAMIIAFLLIRNRVKGGEPSKRHPPAIGRTESSLDKILRIDWIGAGLLAASGILILLALGWGSLDRWDARKVIVSFGVGGGLLVLFVIWERILEHQETSAFSFRFSKGPRVLWADPVMPLAVFTSRDICIVQFSSFVSGMVMLVMFYYVATFMTVVAGLSPQQAGIQLIYFAPGVGAGAMVSIHLIRHFGQPRFSIVLGNIILPIAIGLTAMAIEHNNQSQINGFMVMSGVGVGLTTGPLAIQARFNQPRERIAVVSSLTLSFRSLGGTIGIAQCATVMNSKVHAALSRAMHLGMISPSELQASGFTPNISSISTLNNLPMPVQHLIRGAFKNGLKWAFISLIPWLVVSFGLTLFLRNIEDETGATVNENGAVDKIAISAPVGRVAGLGSEDEGRKIAYPAKQKRTDSDLSVSPVEESLAYLQPEPWVARK